MSRTIKNLKNVSIMTSAALSLGFGLSTARQASAVPILGAYTDDPTRCDVVPNQTLSHELGDASTFPTNEAIFVSPSATNIYMCVADDGIPNDWLVRIQNMTGQSWQNLFFVADLNVGIGNADGYMQDLSNAATPPTEAFRIDGTVTPGSNANLINESGPVDEIFQPGEFWTFVVTNFTIASGALFPPIINSPGVFAGSSPLGSFQSNASILATPVPEPSTVALLLLGVLPLLGRRRRRI